MDSKKARKVFRGVAVGLAFASVLVLAQPAGAVTTRTTGCPGAVSLTQTTAYYDMWGMPVVLAAGPRVYRSNCSTGTQIVRVTYRLYRFENQTWREDRAVWGDGNQNGITLYPNTSYRFSNWGPSVTLNTAYAVTVFIE
jgi:hypothetical protein